MSQSDGVDKPLNIGLQKLSPGILYFRVGDIISSPRLNYFAQSYPPDTFVTCKSYPPDGDTFTADTLFRYTGPGLWNSLPSYLKDADIIVQ